MNNDLATIRQEIRDLTRLAHSGVSLTKLATGTRLLNKGW